MPKIRVLVVEDSVTVRKRLIEVLETDAELEVVGEAGDGKRAIELCLEKRPDVITLDMMLPIMTGVAVTEYVMAHAPTPILIVSASVNRGELFRTYDALAAGALDVLEKPLGNEPDGEWEGRFLASVKMIARIKVITHLRGRHRGLSRAPADDPRLAPGRATAREAIAIGASTGGPGAIVDILRALPAPFPLPILFVLHIGEPFGGAFADWLDGLTPHHVVFARDGEPLAAAQGRVVMAPPERHLVLQGARLRLTSDAPRHYCRPSVDVLFESIAHEMGSSSVACLLTGMGRDGAAGLLAIRRRGGLTIAQDEASSIVYGMPREAAILGAAELVLPLDRIAAALVASAKEPE